MSCFEPCVIENYSYTFTHDPQDFGVAISQCRELGGQLAVVKERRIWNELIKCCKSLDGYWIGLTTCSNLQYNWIDHPSCNPAPFEIDEIPLPQQCVVVEPGQATQGGFPYAYHQSCSNIARTLCQVPMPTSTTNFLTSSTTSESTTEPLTSFLNKLINVTSETTTLLNQTPGLYQARSESLTNDNVNTKIGAVVGGILGLLIILGLVLGLYCRKRGKLNLGSKRAPLTVKEEPRSTLSTGSDVDSGGKDNLGYNSVAIRSKDSSKSSFVFYSNFTKDADLNKNENKVNKDEEISYSHLEIPE